MMLTLRPGTYLSRGQSASSLRYFSNQHCREVPADSARRLEDVALGLVASADDALTRELGAEGWLIEADDILDTIARDMLAGIDARFAWTGATALAGYTAALDAHACRRRLHASFGQYPALPETVARRAALAGDDPLDVLVLGDDDLVSVALAARGHRVVAADADPYMIGLLRVLAERMRLAIEPVRWDFRQAAPEALRGRFDLAFTDPMSGPACIPLFVDRALACVRSGGRVWISVTQAAARIFDVHRRETRVELEHHHADFNHYYAPTMGLSPYVSDLYGVRRLDVSRPALAPDAGFFGSGLYQEERYGLRPASRFVIKDIDTSLSELLHLKHVVNEACALAAITCEEELVHWGDDLRAFLALLPGGQVLAITIDLERKTCDMLMSPPADRLERVFQSALMSVYGRGDVAHTVSRLRSELAAQIV